MTAAFHHRGLVLFAAALGFAGVTLLFVFVEQPGLGTGHFFYLPIALAALVSNRWIGAAAGALAAALYVVAVIMNPHFPPSDLLELSTAIRAVTYVTSGALIGAVASSNRSLVESLRALAERDYLTDLHNVRSFEEELQRRSATSNRFVLLLGDIDGLEEVNSRDGHVEGNLVLQRVAAALRELLGEQNFLARIGGDEFAAITALDDAEAAIAVCRELEAELGKRRIRMSFGWALHPVDGKLPVGLFRRADERLTSSKEQRRSREAVAALLGGGRATS